MMIRSRATRRRLPHIERPGATYFVTFNTYLRWILPPAARDVVLTTIVREHAVTCWLECAVVMPDHVHLIVQPHDDWRLPQFLQRVKSITSHRIHSDAGRLWQEESFDRILRSDETARAKAEYVAMNPVRKGLCEAPDAYPWLWRVWVQGRQ